VQDLIPDVGRIKVTGGLMLTLHLHVVMQSKKGWSYTTTYRTKVPYPSAFRISNSGESFQK
jgi:hypothetical protein